MPSEEPEAEPKVTDNVGASLIEVDDEMLQALPKTEPISKFPSKVALINELFGSNVELI